MRGPRKHLGAHSAGYVLAWAPEHPRASRGRVFEHILVVEKAIGRRLARDEEVHHVNEIKTDNRPENLVVMKRGEHQRLHARLRRERATA